jgi:glycosyltransferase involved in cell wall biosynthesis
MSRPLRFCIVTSAHVANNPRLVREADALLEAGQEVRVVAVEISAEAAGRDRAMLADRSWSPALVSALRFGRGGPRRRWLRRSIEQAAARALSDRGVPGAGLRDRALSRFVADLARIAAERPADVVIAHNVQALPAAARAARRLGARLAFDVEDLHTADFSDPRAHQAEIARIAWAERTYLPRCAVLTAAAPGVADAIAETYRVPPPAVVLNAFPLADRERRPTVAHERRCDVPSLYWFSQTVGQDRGLEEAVDALGILGAPAELHLRGTATDPYRAQLTARAAAVWPAGALRFWPPAPPDEMVALAAEHDVGLALEQPVSRNRRICVTNKLLAYLAAGLAVAATDTEGQRAVLAEAPGAGFAYPAGDAAALAAGLRPLLTDPAALRAARRSARHAAEQRFSWERERETLLRAHGVRPEAAPRPALSAARAASAAPR